MAPTEGPEMLMIEHLLGIRRRQDRPRQNFKK
jgi:hypothetical protein